jgi:hypothetical protein
MEQYVAGEIMRDAAAVETDDSAARFLVHPGNMKSYAMRRREKEVQLL